MAKFAILNKSNTHTDPVRNVRDCFKRGDIIMAFADDYVFSVDEGLPNLLIATVTDLTVETALQYQDEWMDQGSKKMRRRYSLSEANCDAIELAGGEVTLTLTEALSAIKDKAA